MKFMSLAGAARDNVEYPGSGVHTDCGFSDEDIHLSSIGGTGV
jgi:hypothetical protein